MPEVRSGTFPETVAPTLAARHDAAVSRPIDIFEAEALPYMDDLYRTALRLLQDTQKATGAVEETYRRAWRSFPRYARGFNCRIWLFQILFQTMRREQRTSSKWGLHQHEGIGETAAISPSVAAIAVTDDDVLLALDQLPLNLSEVLLLIDVEEFTYTEAGKILDLPLGVVISRLSRARAVLLQLLHASSSTEPGDKSPAR